MNRHWRASRWLSFATLLAALFFPKVTAAWETVHVSEIAPPGWIVINARARRLLLMIDDGVAIRYPIAVPKRGKEWAGEARVDGKYVSPDWAPPPEVKADHPETPVLHSRWGAQQSDGGPRHYPRSFRGCHPWMRRSIGTAASYGCIRMLNKDIVELFDGVIVGTPVLMIP